MSFSSDTKLLYKRGKRNSGRVVTMKDLYCKFNGIPTSTRPWIDLSEPTYLHSLKGSMEIFYNKIISIFDSGIKRIIRFEFSSGCSLETTKDQHIIVPGGFTEASCLKIGDKVVARGTMKPVNNGGKNLKDRPCRVIIHVKYHPYGAVSLVGGYKYKRLSRARLAVEALINKLTLEEYVDILKNNQEKSLKLTFLDPRYDVHHKDENPLNDHIENLQILQDREHSRLHGKNENFNTEYTKIITVNSMEYLGKSNTYNIQMESPINNFCANEVVVCY